MPVHRAGMLEAPVDGNPPWPPRLEANRFRPRRVAAVIEIIKILPSENVPVAVEKGAAQVFGQGFEGAAIIGVVRVSRIVFQTRRDEFVVARIVQLCALKAGRGTLSTHSALTQALPILPGFVAPAMHGTTRWPARGPQEYTGTGQRLREVRNCHCFSVKCVSSSMPMNKNSAP